MRLQKLWSSLNLKNLDKIFQDFEIVLITFSTKDFCTLRIRKLRINKFASSSMIEFFEDPGLKLRDGEASAASLK